MSTALNEGKSGIANLVRPKLCNRAKGWVGESFDIANLSRWMNEIKDEDEALANVKEFWTARIGGRIALDINAIYSRLGRPRPIRWKPSKLHDAKFDRTLFLSEICDNLSF
jgi:hypothetical protein